MPVRDEDGDPLQSPAFLRVIPASVHLGVFCLYFFQSEIWFENELVLAFYNKNRTQGLIRTSSSKADRLTGASTCHTLCASCLAHKENYCKASFGHKL